MIVENHQISYRNVASKRYNFVPEEINLAIEDFEKILSEHGYHIDGKMFFSILSDPTAEVMTAEVFLPIEENTFTISPKEEVEFRSYFCIHPMIMTRIVDDFDQQSQMKYWELLDYIKRHDMKQKTPVFVEYKQSHAGRTYVEMGVGVE
ncbi:DUF5085 family protein [Neobacillus soli]|uniref:DUF5085 family protein n=1 Tax=Neobacillus soli TaxID=220688 RepID=UPI000825F81B|nr:DUF5085 family protein [Neobacillus soli]